MNVRKLSQNFCQSSILVRRINVKGALSSCDSKWSQALSDRGIFGSARSAFRAQAGSLRPNGATVYTLRSILAVKESKNKAQCTKYSETYDKLPDRLIGFHHSMRLPNVLKAEHSGWF